jgi:DNA-directed RNA polymerase subunit RPC12/RpoP
MTPPSDRGAPPPFRFPRKSAIMAGEMSYQTAHKSMQGYKLLMMWVMIGLFMIALALTFIHPSLAIIMLWLGIVVFALGVFVGKVVFQRVERSEARRELRGHHCPGCGAEFEGELSKEDEWKCAECGAVFLPSGAEQV